MDIIVRSSTDAEAMLSFIQASAILAYDTESTGLNVRKDTVIGFGISDGSTSFYLPLHIYNPTLGTLVPNEAVSTHATRILEALQKKALITWNASFDMRITRSSLGVDLLGALHADVLLMKHTCDEEYPFGLKEVAAKIYGHEAKAEKEEMLASVKSNGGTATEYYKADTSILGKYCMADCKLTTQLHDYYLAELKKQDLEKFYFVDEVLPLYKEVVIPMESAGVEIDIAYAEQILSEISTDILVLETAIQAEISDKLQLFTAWFLNKDYPLKTFTGKEPAWTKKYGTQMEAWSAENEGPMFELHNKHHLKKLFFDTLKEMPISYTKPSKTYPNGQPQVDEDFLGAMSAKYPWCTKLVEFNKLCKIKSTYIERFVSESENGRFYPSYKMHGTVTGRLSSDFQQMPRTMEAGQASALIVKYTNSVRNCVIAKRVCKLVSADYDSLEPRIFAHESKDTAIIRIFNEGLDFYSEVAINVENLIQYSPDKKATNYLGAMNKIARQDSKKYALGFAYGETPYKLKFELRCTEDEAKAKYNKYWDAFPTLADEVQNSRAEVRENGVIRHELGRVRRMPLAPILYRKYGSCIEDDLELWKRYHEYGAVYTQAKKDRKRYKKMLNSAFNFRVQGLGASIINRASIELARAFKIEGMLSMIIGQVHDQLLVVAPENEVDKAASMLSHYMSNTTKISVPLPAEAIIGERFSDCK